MIKSALKNSRILLVDDEDILVEGLAEFLQDQGTVVDTANDGQEAMALLQEHVYDLLVTDIRMPGMSGMELLRHVQENHAGVAVILMTGYASTESAIEALRLGVYDYIEKPFEMLELLQAIPAKMFQGKEETTRNEQYFSRKTGRNLGQHYGLIQNKESMGGQ